MASRTVDHVYIIQCENDVLYVGETINPQNRFKQHFSKRGGCKVTALNKAESIQCIYPVRDYISFYNEVESDTKYKLCFETNYDLARCNKKYEDYITEKLVTIKLPKPSGNLCYTPDKIFGGVYTRSRNLVPCPPSGSIWEAILNEIPTCDCDFPAAIYQDPDSKSFNAICAKKNISKYGENFCFGTFCTFKQDIDVKALKEKRKSCREKIKINDSIRNEYGIHRREPYKCSECGKELQSICGIYLEGITSCEECDNNTLYTCSTCNETKLKIDMKTLENFFNEGSKSECAVCYRSRSEKVNDDVKFPYDSDDEDTSSLKSFSSLTVEVPNNISTSDLSHFSMLAPEIRKIYDKFYPHKGKSLTKEILDNHNSPNGHKVSWKPKPEKENNGSKMPKIVSFQDSDNSKVEPFTESKCNSCKQPLTLDRTDKDHCSQCTLKMARENLENARNRLKSSKEETIPKTKENFTVKTCKKCKEQKRSDLFNPLVDPHVCTLCYDKYEIKTLKCIQCNEEKDIENFEVEIGKEEYKCSKCIKKGPIPQPTSHGPGFKSSWPTKINWPSWNSGERRQGRFTSRIIEQNNIREDKLRRLHQIEGAVKMLRITHPESKDICQVLESILYD